MLTWIYFHSGHFSISTSNITFEKYKRFILFLIVPVLKIDIKENLGVEVVLTGDDGSSATVTASFGDAMEVDIDGDKKTITDGVSNDRARIVNIYITCLSASFKVQYNSS